MGHRLRGLTPRGKSELGGGIHAIQGPSYCVSILCLCHVLRVSQKPIGEIVAVKSKLIISGFSCIDSFIGHQIPLRLRFDPHICKILNSAKSSINLAACSPVTLRIYA